MKRALPLLLAVVACSGKTELPPHGEALFVVDTDVAVPQLAGRLRVDLFDESGAWIESRDIGRSDPSAFPASFSVYSDDDTRDKRVLVRLRVYPEGLVRDYLGERYEARPTFTEPKVAGSLAELCASAPELPINGRVTMRRGGTAITQTVHSNTRCSGPDVAGSVAARVTITTAGSYRFGVADAFPYYTESVLALRKSCEDVTSQLACDGEPSANVLSPGHFPRVDATLDPGTYFLVTTGRVAEWPADLTLESLALDSPPVDEQPPAPAPEPTQPRLHRPGHTADETPAREPLPSVTIDRLVLVRLKPGQRGSVRVTLRGACAGTMARLGADPQSPAIATASTCVDQEDQLVPITETALDADLERRDPSVQNTFTSAQSCDGVTTASSEKVCIPGGAFVLGSRILSPEPGTLPDTVPERIARIPRFTMDRHEVTVARMRDAIARGFTIDQVGLHANENDLASPPFCTWSTAQHGREDMPVNCIGWRLARAFCQFEGGDLPTEAEWEYAAQAAGRPFKTAQPWGDDEPDCLRAVVARSPQNRPGDRSCAAAGLPVGPAKVTDSDRRDVSPQGVVGLSGNVSEWTLDSAASYASACWRSAPLESPRCWEENAPLRIARGGAWDSEPSGILHRSTVAGVVGGAGYSTILQPQDNIGFRCVYEEATP